MIAWLIVRDQIMVPLEGLGLILIAAAYLLFVQPVIPFAVAMLIAAVVLN